MTVLILWLGSLCLSLPQMASTDFSLNQFEPDSYQEIVDSNNVEPFLMVFWSLDCPPCIDELLLLARFHKHYPRAKVIMVSTDSVRARDEIEQLMKQRGLHDLEHWVFTDNSIQAIRYAIDPLWYGELPRSYFHSHNQPRQARSGRLNEQTLLLWFKATDNRT